MACCMKIGVVSEVVCDMSAEIRAAGDFMTTKTAVLDMEIWKCDASATDLPAGI